MTIERINTINYERVRVNSPQSRLVVEFTFYKDESRNTDLNLLANTSGSIPCGMSLDQLISWFEYNTATLKQLKAEGLYKSEK